MSGNPSVAADLPTMTVNRSKEGESATTEQIAGGIISEVHSHSTFSLNFEPPTISVWVLYLLAAPSTSEAQYRHRERCTAEQLAELPCRTFFRAGKRDQTVSVRLCRPLRPAGFLSWEKPGPLDDSTIAAPVSSLVTSHFLQFSAT
ncbi:hypothetical protein ON010_g14275 [Phytophthora cinnamomi]|nr:hypothetical protein ON010_g14275 [Phytophthora cinnamomi]